MQDYVSRIKNILDAKKITLKALSNETGISYRTLQDNFQKNSGVSVDNLRKIATFLRVSYDDLLSTDEDPHLVKTAASHTSVKGKDHQQSVATTGHNGDAVTIHMLGGSLHLDSDPHVEETHNGSDYHPDQDEFNYIEQGIVKDLRKLSELEVLRFWTLLKEKVQKDMEGL